MLDNVQSLDNLQLKEIIKHVNTGPLDWSCSLYNVSKNKRTVFAAHTVQFVGAVAMHRVHYSFG